LLGIVGMLTSAQTGLNVREQNAQNIAADEVFRTWGANHHFFRRHIPRRAAIAAAAGNDIAYHCDDVVRGWFDVLGAEISERLQWDDDSPSDHPPDSAIQEEERARRVPPQPGAINP